MVLIRISSNESFLLNIFDEEQKNEIYQALDISRKEIRFKERPEKQASSMEGVEETTQQTNNNEVDKTEDAMDVDNREQQAQVQQNSQCNVQ